MSPAAANAASYPPGVAYPLTPATNQPSGLAQPLPSSRRYVMVWKDQMIPDAYSSALMTWVVTHYVGTQKLFQRQIDAYRNLNPNFLMFTYHLAYGLNGADQTNPVGNITGPNTFGQEDTDTFTPYVQTSGITRENAYEHYTTPPGTATRVSYPDPYWLMDISSTEWQTYLSTTLLQWMAFPTKNATGVFFDVAFPPWYNYSPANWWTGPAGGSSRQALDTWWFPLAQTYFDGLRTAFALTASHPRYLVIPNTDALVDGTDEDSFLDGTDGVFTENWQKVATDMSPGDWNLSVRRICHYVTAHGKLWSIDVTVDASTLSATDRILLIGTYFLVRNGTSYIMIGGGDLSWWPEYELDLGGYLADPPDDIEQLRVAGTGGSSGGLYKRDYAAGFVLVNSSNAALSFNVPSPMQLAVISGGGLVASDGTEAAQTVDYSTSIAAGAYSVGPLTAVILQSPGGPPAPGIETSGADAGTGGPDGGTASPDSGNIGADAGTADGGSSPSADAGSTTTDGGGAGHLSGGCNCTSGSGAGLGVVIALGITARRRRPMSTST